jgi:hypothetical protein
VSLITCPHCKQEVDKPAQYVNRAAKDGYTIYCSRKCSGLARRMYKPKAQKVAEKRLYDMDYRRKNLASIKAKKAAHFQKTYDPVKAAQYRKENMARHIAYCQRPEYKQWKQGYDQQFRARKLFGPFAESFLILQEIEKEIASRMTKYDIALDKGYYNKAQHRRREYERLIRG